MNNPKFVIQVCKGLIRDLRSRRLLMFYAVLAALLQLFAGSTLLWGVLRDHPLCFLAYWAACAWITFLVMLLALYDLLRVRADAARLRRRKGEEVEMAERSEDEDAR